MIDQSRMTSDIFEVLSFVRKTTFATHSRVVWVSVDSRVFSAEAKAEEDPPPARRGAGHSQVVIVEPPAEFKDEPFSRGKAMNMLHKACDDKAMVIAMDIDMEFTEGFLDRVRAFVIPGKSVYFPIVWSTYNPANIDKLAKFYGCERNALGRHYSGVWRSWGYGIYAMYGADAKRHMLSESFIGWGGEDNDWFKRLRDKLHIFRARERGLIHLWHTESCDEKKRSCYASKARLEGPALGFMIDKDGKPKHEEAGF